MFMPDPLDLPPLGFDAGAPLMTTTDHKVVRSTSTVPRRGGQTFPV
jgi:hypothetical protein